jgi:thiol-disulfide isomerase/thioredoxin
MANNNKSNNKANNMSSKLGKTNWALIAGLVLLGVVLVALYYMKRSNDISSEGFIANNGGKNNNRPMKNSNSLISGTNIANKLNPAKGECVVALFYADWCPHCVRFKPHFEQVMNEVNGQTGKDGKKLRLELVDCVANADLGKKYDVSGYPTVKILNDDGTQIEYGGERTYEGLRKYLVSNN